jgi:hypothetical protein
MTLILTLTYLPAVLLALCGQHFVAISSVGLYTLSSTKVQIDISTGIAREIKST